MTTTTCGRCFPLDRCYCRTTAADLPVGTVVAGGYVQWEKYRQATDTDASAWESELGDRWPDRYIDQRIAEGARLLRVGQRRTEQAAGC